MPPSMLRCIQRRVKSARDQLTEQQLDTSTIPESLGDLIEWCKDNDFFVALKRHDDPNDPYCIPLYKAFVIGMDITPEYQVIQINFASVWFLLNAVRAIETGWVVQLNGNATFGFCRADINMIALSFCSFGGSNNPVCFSYIPHQTEGEKLYKVTFFEMQQAVMAVLKAKTVKDCEFSPCVRALKCRDHVATYLESEEFAANQLPIDQAQCDQLPGWACFSRDVFGFPPNICVSITLQVVCPPLFYCRIQHLTFFYCAGIAAANYHHVHHFTGPDARDKYD